MKTNDYSTVGGDDLGGSSCCSANCIGLVRIRQLEARIVFQLHELEFDSCDELVCPDVDRAEGVSFFGQDFVR